MHSRCALPFFVFDFYDGRFKPRTHCLAGVARRGVARPLRCESTTAGHPRVGLLPCKMSVFTAQLAFGLKLLASSKSSS